MSAASDLHNIKDVVVDIVEWQDGSNILAEQIGIRIKQIKRSGIIDADFACRINREDSLGHAVDEGDNSFVFVFSVDHFLGERDSGFSVAKNDTTEDENDRREHYEPRQN